MKIQKCIFFLFYFGGGGGGGGGRAGSGCENSKKNWGGGSGWVWGVRLDGTEK